MSDTPYSPEEEVAISDLKADPPKPLYDYRSPQLFSKLTIALLLLSLAAILTASASLGWIMIMCQQGISGTYPVDDLWDLAFSINEIAETIYWALYFVTLFVFGTWIVKTCKNTFYFSSVLKTERTGHLRTNRDLPTPTMSILNYGIPILSFWYPYKNMQTFDKVANASGTPSARRLLPFWWLLYLFSNFSQFIFENIWGNTHTYESIFDAAAYNLAAYAPEIALCLIAILMVYRITRGQLTTQEKLTLQESLPSQPTLPND